MSVRKMSHFANVLIRSSSMDDLCTKMALYVNVYVYVFVCELSHTVLCV